ncbi:MAG: O-acetyl-ADP-ribose deacetylase [Spirochaetales bacterium]|uniref:O-acetyl-ADP-ribose deacetylase n=1 Tax=Candidatus Thalassospirochaeta sargassi TaxID=3119039 RepID=A0AAJ1IDN3_9SPIO|nr:O-acetyl-ADP-ribose deacetylase [Spirochaetales bacterium]
MEQFLSDRLTVSTGDITSMDVDAIVNAANSSLYGGGGVDGAIHRAGGPSILEECRDIRSHRYPDGLPPGKAVITKAGDMSCDYVIHTVGPIWHGGKTDEREVLADAYRNSLKLASETGIKTVAFPAISTGIYGFPKKLAAVIAFETIQEHLRRNSLPRQVKLVFFSESDLECFNQAVDKSRMSV